MKRWLTELPEWSGLVSLDPIRTRIFWLGSLTARERTRYLDEAESLTLRAIRRIQERITKLEAEGRPWHAIGTEGALRELEARLRWLRDVRARR